MEFASVSAGDFHTCGVKRDGAVACWGVSSPRSAPGTATPAGFACWGVGEATPPGGEFASVSVGGDHTCGVKRRGRLLGRWRGQVRLGQRRVPLHLRGEAGRRGRAGALRIRPGHAAARGVRLGQRRGLPHLRGEAGRRTAMIDGKATPPGGEFASVSVGNGGHTCGVKQDGAVGWGGGEATPPGGEFASVSAGDFHTCGVKRDGAVACWGSQARGLFE